MDDEDKKKMTLNTKAKNVLTCALRKNEYSRVSSCASAYEMWKLLEMTHEGTSQVKNSKINLLVSKYEKFEMSSNESIGDMFHRFNVIVISLKSLGKKLTIAEQVQKILRSLPQMWEAKVMAIREAKDLETLQIDQLMGSLLTHEIERKEPPTISSEEASCFEGFHF